MGRRKEFDQNKVLDKAIELFWREGYNATSIQDLVAHLGISRSRRALGLCHLLTFGPLFIWFSLNFQEIYEGWGIFGPLFVIEYCIIGLCLYLDLRDLILHLCSLPFPCYIRDYHRLGINIIDDKRVEQPVTLFSIFFW